MDDTSSCRGFWRCTMSIFGRDGIDTRHGWLSFCGWMDYPNQGLESDALSSSTLFSCSYSRIFNDIIFGEVCLNWFNFVEVKYDSLSTASRLWSLYLAGVVEVFVDILFIWKISDRTFSRVSLSYPIWKTRSLGECMGWTKRATLGFTIIVPLKYIIGHGPWGRATNN